MVYVDALLICLKSTRWKHNHSCHLFSNDLDELHAFAKQLNLRRGWFQDRPGFPHYDLTKAKRDQAIGMGAEEIDRKFVGEFMQARRLIN